ncbi:hypothetical protein [Saccharolobus islandicus]|uniref:hypothetical protein n=1 Tax=Saccharolobus islandicus TaxID=43080 RepID=UPI000A56E00E|nr:hypothetical protein [Sulfolobus islandicus]
MDINANEILRNLVDEMLSDVEDIPELLQGLTLRGLRGRKSPSVTVDPKSPP